MKKHFTLKIISYILFLACVILAVPSCGAPKKVTLTYLDYFDTVTTFVTYTGDKELKNRATEILECELKRYHRLFDIYNTYESINNLKTVNDNAGIEAVSVSEEIIDLLEFSLLMHGKTDGYVNVAMGSVLSLWHDARELAYDAPDSAALPDISALTAAAEHCDISSIIIDKDAHSVFITDPDTSIDAGAIAKGYAAQKIADALRAAGIADFLLNLGGNVVASGYKPDSQKWSVSIQDPQNPTNALAMLALTDLSLVTSGSYQRYFTLGDKSYHHIIHPETLMPGDTFTSVSVLSADSAVADALSTALFNMTLEDGKALVASYASVEAMWVLSSGEIVYSDGFLEFAEGKR